MTDKIVKKIYCTLRNFIRIRLNRKKLEKILNERSKNITSIGFEVTNICNANCSFCAYRYMTRPKGIMNLDLYKKILITCVKNGITDIVLGTIVGDPLEDPHLVERIKFAKRFGQIKTIAFYTNLIGISRFGAREILLSGLTDIAISTTFEGPEFYKKYFSVNRYDEVIANIKNFCSLNMSLGKPVNINIELRMPAQFCSFLGLRKNRIYRQIAPLVNDINFNYHYDSWLGLIKKNDIPEGCRFISMKNKFKMPCQDVFGENIMIMLDGKVNICGCVNFNANDELIIGDIKEDTLNNIWQGNKIKKLRKNWFEGKAPLMCKDCRFYRSILSYLCK